MNAPTSLVKARTTVILFIALGLLLVCSGCGKFKSGQKVWIDLPATPERASGYAEGNIVELKGAMALIQITSVEQRGAAKSAQGITPGAAGFVPVDRVSDWEGGHRRYIERQSVYENFDRLLGSLEAYSREGTKPLRSLATDHGMSDIVASLDVLDVTASPLWVIRNSGNTKEALRQATAAMGQLRDVLKRQDGAYELACTPGASRGGDIPSAQLATSILREIHESVEHGLAGQPSMDATDAVLEDLRAADRAYYLFISDGGRLPIDGLTLDLFMERRWAQHLSERTRNAHLQQARLEAKTRGVPYINTEGAPAIGPPDAPVTIVEFACFECPFSAKVAPTLKQIREAYGSKVRLVWKHLPLALWSGARLSHLASLAANEQGKFWEYHDKVFAAPSDRHGRDALLFYAMQLGLDGKKFQEAIDTAKYETTLAADTAEAKSLGLNGTPAFFINGHFLSGAKPFQEFAKMIDNELGRATPSR